MPEICIAEEDGGSRLDAFLAAHVADMSRSTFQRLIDEGCVTVNGAQARASQKLKAGEIIAYSVPAAKPAHTAAEELPLDIIYEDDDLIVINKPKGMVVHPAPGSESGTLVNALLAHCKGLSAIGGEERPGIVHRLDKDTSGLIVVAKNDVTHRKLQSQIQARTAMRKYLALVWGDPRFQQAEVDAPIGRHPTDRKKMAVIESADYRSREAVTDLRVLERFGPFTLLEASLRTGRTHQIRVHTAFAGHPVVGDPVYSNDRRLHVGHTSFVLEVNHLIDELGGQALHAYYLSFDHPKTGERLEFTAPMPAAMQNLVDYIRAHSGE
jgi:23S rRNA pseudouridine1911/1915/1917 synthase